MSDRETFESFWRSSMNTYAFGLERTEYPMTSGDAQQYLCHETNRGWLAWQAARAQGDEYAAYLEGMNSHLKAELESARTQAGNGAGVVPEEWKLVPCHADAAMIRIGKRAHNEEFLFHQDPDSNIQGIWKAMIAAAPTAPAVEVLVYRYRIKGDPQGWEYSTTPLFGAESVPGPNEEYQILDLEQACSELNDVHPHNGEQHWIERANLNKCRYHGDDHEACATYSGQIPCDREGGERARLPEAQCDAINHALDVLSKHGDAFTSVGAMRVLEGMLNPQTEREG